MNLGRFSASQLALRIVKSDIICFKIFYLFVVVPLPHQPLLDWAKFRPRNLWWGKGASCSFPASALEFLLPVLTPPMSGSSRLRWGRKGAKIKGQNSLKIHILLAGCLGEAAVHVLTLLWVIWAVWNLIDRSLPSVSSGRATSLFALGQELANYSSWAKSSLPPVFVWLTS